MSNNSIDRFAKYVINESITAIGNVSSAIDYNYPLDYKAWLNFFTDTSVSIETYNRSYKKYVNEWNKVKTTFLDEQNNLVKENYINILKELSIDVFTEQERRFLKAVDYNNADQVDSVLPLVARKLQKLTNYFSSFREKVKTQPRRNNIYSSSSGVKLFLTNLFRDLLLYNSNTISLFNENLIDKSFVLDNTNFVIEELYDDYQNYFDLDNNIPLSGYEYGGQVRKDQWTSNTNEFDPDIFIDYDTSATKILSSYEYVIENFVSNLSVPVALASSDLSYYKNKDFINQINRGDIDELNIQNKIKLFNKFIGTDWYYLSTGTTNSETFSGLLIKSENESSNFLNRNNVSTGSVPNSATLVKEANIGGYYTPPYLGTLIYNSFSYSYNLNYSKLSNNNIYYYPDPEKYISTYGNSLYKRSVDIFDVYENTYVVTYDISNAAAFGYINDNSYYLNFHGYENTEEKNNLDDTGVSRSYDKVDFFKGKTSDIFSNTDVYASKNRALYPIDKRQNSLLVTKNDLTFNTSDVYGNNYGLLKPSSSLPFTNEKSSFKNITTKYLFISNGTFFYNNSPFDYEVAAQGGYGNDFRDIIPSRSFTFSLSSTVQALFTQYLPNILNYGTFTMPWPFISGTFYLKGNTFDGSFYTTYDGTLLPDTPGSDSPAWDSNSVSYYYNILLDGGSDINGKRPNFLRSAVFTKELSSTVDGGRFIFNDEYYNSKKYLNNKYNIPYYDTVNPKLSTSFVEVTPSTNSSIYNKKYVTKSDSYFRNSSNIVTALSAALSSVYLKYSGFPNVYNELNNDVIKLDTVYDIAVIETSNYLVIEKINYDFKTNTVTVNDSNIRFITRTTQGDNQLEKFGNFFYHEPSNTILFHKTTLAPSLSSTNFKSLYPSFYKLELDNLILKQIYPKKTYNVWGEVRKYSLITNQSIFNPRPVSEVSIYNAVSIDRPVLSYDDQSNVYGYMYKAVDLSDCIAFYYQNFKFKNGAFINIKSDIYFQEATIRDENYSNFVNSSVFKYNALEGTSGNEWIKEEGVLKLGEQQ